MPLPRLTKECQTGGLMSRLYGMTYAPLTANRGVAKWILSLADTPASRSVRLAKEREPMTTDGFGATLLELSMKSSHRSASLKTYLGILRTDLNLSRMTWSEWVIKLLAACSARRRLARHTNASDSSLWRTILASESSGGCLSDATYEGRKNRKMSKRIRDQARQHTNWQTPTAKLGETGAIVPPKGYQKRKSGKLVRTTINGSTFGQNLAEQSASWGTPRVSAKHQPCPAEIAQGNPKQRLETGAAIYSLQDQTATGQKLQMRLNPRFCEGLMGMPIGWANLRPLATGLSPYLRLMRLSLLHLHSRANNSPQQADQPPLFTPLKD